jgi:hypothetical protein
MDGEYICLPKTSISKNRVKENDENISELESKSFWYKLHKRILVSKCIWSYLFQFLTVVDEPRVALNVIIMVTRVCN